MIEAFDVSEYPTHIAAEIKDFNPEEYMDKKEARRMDRFVQFAVVASAFALKDANLNVQEDTDPERVGVMSVLVLADLALGKISIIFC